jgi:hypothetical protein
MKRIIRVGKPTHFMKKTKQIGNSVTYSTACGLGSIGFSAAFDPRDVDCLTCLNTRAYREAMHPKKEDLP